MLERSSANLEDKDYVGNQPTPETACSGGSCPPNNTCQQGVCRPDDQLKQVQCSADVLQKAIGPRAPLLGSLDTWNSTDLTQLAYALLDGQGANTASMGTVSPSGNEYRYTHPQTQQLHYIHYLCEDTGHINGGANGSEICPVGSKIVFFDVQGINNATMQQDSCQQNGTCATRLQQLETTPNFRKDVPYECNNKLDPDKNVSGVFCDKNRQDLREGKAFFTPPASSNVYVSPYKALHIDIEDAFRYRIKFQSRSGQSIAFAPAICQEGTSSLTPYCYDPKAIESLQERVNCLEYIYTNNTLYQKLGTRTGGQTLQNELKDQLIFTFSYKNTLSADGTILTHFGFETLNAELRVMLGDEAYTQSLTSRYDLAGQRLLSFDGDLFEPNGIKLTGALGFEMFKLYQATQYYQSVLDRFFSQTSVIYHSFQTNERFITAAAVTSYFQKLLLASTRKARAFGQIARRYHDLNRADLARHVVERSYVSTYMEQLILARLLRELMRIADSAKIPEVSTQIDKAMLTYRAALLDMEEVYKDLSTEVNAFGLPAGYIPFPAIDPLAVQRGVTNAFETTLDFAKSKIADAREKELIALQSKRDFQTDAASFQSELVQIQQNYENELIDLCGGMMDGNKVVPAIPRYAHISPDVLRLGNPCGRLPKGQIYEAFLRIGQTRLAFQSLKIEQENILRQIQLEEERIQRYCAAKFTVSDIVWQLGDKRTNLQEASLRSKLLMSTIQNGIQGAMMTFQAKQCIETGYIVILPPPAPPLVSMDCPSAKAAAATVATVQAARAAHLYFLNQEINKKQIELSRLNQQQSTTRLQIECNLCEDGSVCTNNVCKDGKVCKEGIARTESNIRLQQLRSQMLNFDLQALQIDYTLSQALSDMLRLQQQAQKLITDLDENLQLAINVQAARNDPNIRIYKNDAIITAERTFNEAIREAYRATLVYEYYTGSSYTRKGDLFFIRMITAGDRNLEAYISQLEQAYRAFEEQNGKPDTRILILSLRDDILKLPRSVRDQATSTETPLSLNERVKKLGEILRDPARLNEEGYLAFPFAISLDKTDSLVSPVTSNHRILYVEAEIKGTQVGDEIGRIYLRQKGTGVMRLADETLKFYALPNITSVVNTFFNGTKPLPAETYSNQRLHDRPLGNSQWELLFNQATEPANQDINLNSVSDIVLYIYYTDFTKSP
ncbi:MAG: hypothetical protein H6728_03580 [Myxococcales bacterium]|nr:hypothetical protein [Myxococcales bacterium]